MKNNPPSPRQTALNCLRSWHAGRSFAETLVDRECSRAALPPADRHLVQALVFSVLRNQTWLDHVIGTLRKGKLDVEARLILQLGLSQLFLLGMADHAAVYETVNLASVRLRGLVNAILRNALRREKTILEDREKLPLSIHYSTPAWLVQRWTEQMGPQMTRDLLRWNNTTPRLYVRANPLIPMKNIPASLAPLDRAPGWFSVEGLLPLEEIKTGSLYVADPSTRYSIDLLAPPARRGDSGRLRRPRRQIRSHHRRYRRQSPPDRHGSPQTPAAHPEGKPGQAGIPLRQDGAGGLVPSLPHGMEGPL